VFRVFPAGIAVLGEGHFLRSIEFISFGYVVGGLAFGAHESE
jgi:hypothetical protein